MGESKFKKLMNSVEGLATNLGSSATAGTQTEPAGTEVIKSLRELGFGSELKIAKDQETGTEYVRMPLEAAEAFAKLSEAFALFMRTIN